MTTKTFIFTIFLFCILSNLGLAQNEVTERDILILNDSIELPGTLSFQKDKKTQPLVVFIHGSGNVDRNGNQMGVKSNANYIKQLADSLSKRGIAFFRYDKRTSNVNNIQKIMNDLSFKAFSEDAKIVVDSLKKNKHFSSIHLIGHSQGSLVAMLTVDEDINSYISIAGPSRTIDNSIIDQVRLQNGDSIASIVDSHFKELIANDSIANVNPMLMALFNKPTQPFLREWMQFNPSEEIKKLQIPILIINGEKDLQVSIQDAQSLHEANPNSTLVLINNMNHVLKRIDKDGDNLTSYAIPDYPLSTDLVDEIEKFIKQ